VAACGEPEPLGVPSPAGGEWITKDAAYRSGVTTGSFAPLTHGHCYYELSGPALGETDLPLLVLVHGFSVPSFIWDPTFEEAVRRGRPVLRLDLYGRGHSSNPDVAYDVDLFAGQVLELLDHLGVDGPVDLAGLSMGGPVAIRVAALEPGRIRTLVLVSPGSFSPGDGAAPDPTQPTPEQVERFEAEVLATWAEGQAADFFDPGAFPDWTERCRPWARHEGFARALLSTWSSSRPLKEEHRSIQAANYPVHMVWGRQDEVVVYEQARALVEERVPRAEVHLFDACGHLPQMEHPVPFGELLFDRILDR
jgi:pimeloyl-ACP methyl ester carboxylesterase